MPGDDTDLETTYTAGEVTDVATKNDVRVGQTATDEYAIHQYKYFIGGMASCTVEWEGQTGREPSASAVYLQVYNQDTTTWETLDSDNTSAVDTDFSLTGEVPDTTDYLVGGVISCRVYQEAK